MLKLGHMERIWAVQCFAFTHFEQFLTHGRMKA